MRSNYLASDNKKTYVRCFKIYLRICQYVSPMINYVFQNRNIHDNSKIPMPLLPKSFI